MWAAKKRGRRAGVESQILGSGWEGRQGEWLSQASPFPSGVISQQGSKVS